MLPSFRGVEAETGMDISLGDVWWCVARLEVDGEVEVNWDAEVMAEVKEVEEVDDTVVALSGMSVDAEETEVARESALEVERRTRSE